MIKPTKIKVVFLTLALVCGFALSGAETANASSPYDNYFLEPAQNLQMSNIGQTVFRPISIDDIKNFDWITNSTNYNSLTTTDKSSVSNFIGLLNNPNMASAVMMYSVDTYQPIRVVVYVYDPVNQPNFSTNSGTGVRYLKAGNWAPVYMLSFEMPNSGTGQTLLCTMMCGLNHFSAFANAEYGHFQYFEGTITNAGYDPINIIPQTLTVPSTDLTYQPHFSLTGANGTFTANYTHKTTDPSSTLIDPAEVRWNITDYDIADETSPIGTKLMCDTLTIPISQSFTNSDCLFTHVSGHRYAVIMGIFIGNATVDNFDNGDAIYNITYKMSSIEILFSNGSYTTNTTGCSNGTIAGDIGFGNNCNSEIIGIQDVLDQCMNADFPYLHVDSCFNFLGGTLNLLSFNTLKFGTSFNYNNQCHNLVMLDDWLGLPDNYELCPQFPSYIRNVVTPFITLFLGLITVRFLTVNRPGSGGIE